MQLLDVRLRIYCKLISAVCWLVASLASPWLPCALAAGPACLLPTTVAYQAAALVLCFPPHRSAPVMWPHCCVSGGQRGTQWLVSVGCDVCVPAGADFWHALHHSLPCYIHSLLWHTPLSLSVSCTHRPLSRDHTWHTHTYTCTIHQCVCSCGAGHRLRPPAPLRLPTRHPAAAGQRTERRAGECAGERGGIFVMEWTLTE